MLGESAKSDSMMVRGAEVCVEQQAWVRGCVESLSPVELRQCRLGVSMCQGVQTARRRCS